MAELSIAKSLNKAYRHKSIDKVSFDEFKSQLATLFEQIASVDTEEKVKGDLMDFLKLTFYRQNYKVSPNGKIDAARYFCLHSWHLKHSNALKKIRLQLCSLKCV